MDAHRERDHKACILTPDNKRKGAYGCCLDLIASQITSEIAKLGGDPKNLDHKGRQKSPAEADCDVETALKKLLPPPAGHRAGPQGRTVP